MSLLSFSLKKILKEKGLLSKLKKILLNCNITLDPDLDPDLHWQKFWIRILIQCNWIHNTAPKGLCRLANSIIQPTYEVGRLGELVEHLHPEINGLVVDPPQLRGQLHLVNAKRDTLRTRYLKLTKDTGTYLSHKKVNFLLFQLGALSSPSLPSQSCLGQHKRVRRRGAGEQGPPVSIPLRGSSYV